MPTKPKAKVKPKPKVRWQDSATRFVRAKPMLTWSTIASIVAVAGGLWTGGAWFFNRFQLVEAAELANTQIRAQIAQQSTQIAQQSNEYRAFHTEALYGQQNILTTILKNALTACEKSAKKALACEQERRDYQEAYDRNQILYRSLAK